ncbi:MAG: AAA family ATPase [Simplicispira suum]|uniref:AAA family ATPase n=1 Tax=Simplicispira suum TaxID=2109915 RepID=UPI001C6B5C56|nr:AAA family ATPase [Simplicispira suum]MBW7832459.1 AAA family ATPase [Simplicispira suum]
MTILQEIIKWAMGLPIWQQDAISRLIAKGVLDSADIDDLYALLKVAHGIPDHKGRIANPVDPDDIPLLSDGSSLVQITAIRDLKHVNALAEEQVIPIAATGLTAIYGGNGAGKSGYSRVLKRACRARDQSERIRPNAALSPGKAGTATATFDLLINGKASSVEWIDKQAAPDALSAIAIFDSLCARAYIDKDDDFSYVPYGLDVLEGLAKTFNQLKNMVEAESAKSVPNTLPYASLSATSTAVGKLLSGLGAKTKASDVEVMCAITDDETARLAALEKGLKEGNPKEKSQLLKLRRSRFAKLNDRCKEKLGLLSEAALNELRALVDASRAAKAAADIAAAQFREKPGILPGTGGDAWQELFAAARKFAIESHATHKFPNLGPDAACPLCQQPLSAGADRLVAFDQFIQGEAEALAREKRRIAKVSYEALVAADLNIHFDADLKTELGVINPALPAQCEFLQTTLLERRKKVKDACAIGGDWSSIEAVSDEVCQALSQIEEQLRQEIDVLDKATDEEHLAALANEYRELDARRQLVAVKSAVLDAIIQFGIQAKLSTCIPALRTNSISVKSTELVDKVVSKGLADALNAEFQLLHVQHLNVNLKSSTVKGKTLHKLIIQMPGGFEPKEVLSEGEQRAIAIGSFLAEVNISGATGGVVFDDPVSSLDHVRRELVARRLASEALKRQVIVFTHDLYFLSLLQHEAGQVGALMQSSSLRRTTKGFGVASDSLPFDGAGAKARIGLLKTMQVDAAKLHKEHDEEGYSQRARQTYQRLRDAWERTIEEVLLNGVVWRFKPGISTQSLREVAVEDGDYAAIQTGMGKCSKYAHDGAAQAQVSLPLPTELLDDIHALEAWRESILSRRKKLLQDRPK